MKERKRRMISIVLKHWMYTAIKQHLKRSLLLSIINQNKDRGFNLRSSSYCNWTIRSKIICQTNGIKWRRIIPSVIWQRKLSMRNLFTDSTHPVSKWILSSDSTPRCLRIVLYEVTQSNINDVINNIWWSLLLPIKGTAINSNVVAEVRRMEEKNFLLFDEFLKRQNNNTLCWSKKLQSTAILLLDH